MCSTALALRRRGWLWWRVWREKLLLRDDNLRQWGFQVHWRDLYPSGLAMWWRTGLHWWPGWVGTTVQWVYSALILPHLHWSHWLMLGVEERCPGEMFQCHLEGNCIPNNWTCDGHPDCDDKSDENDCGNYIVHPLTRSRLNIKPWIAFIVSPLNVGTTDLVIWIWPSGFWRYYIFST